MKERDFNISFNFLWYRCLQSILINDHYLMSHNAIGHHI